MRTKVLLSLHPDVLKLIDDRAAHHRMTRSAYIAMCALGINHDDSHDASTEIECEVCKGPCHGH